MEDLGYGGVRRVSNSYIKRLHENMKPPSSSCSCEVVMVTERVKLSISEITGLVYRSNRVDFSRKNASGRR